MNFLYTFYFSQLRFEIFFPPYNEIYFFFSTFFFLTIWVFVFQK